MSGGRGQNICNINPSPPSPFPKFHEPPLQLLQYCTINNLVVRHLNLYVGNERIHCFLVVRPVAMNPNAVVMVVMGNRDPK